MPFVFCLPAAGRARLLTFLAVVTALGGGGGCGSSAAQSRNASDKVSKTPPPNSAQIESSRSDDTPRAASVAHEPADEEHEVQAPSGPHALSVSAPVMASVRPTTHEAALRKIGLDPFQLPTMESLSPAQRYQVMDLISSSLGVACDGCHMGKNFRTATPQKEVARLMWNEMTAAFRLREGALFCDSCHQGSALNLKRDNKPQLEDYMRAEYVGKLLTSRDDAAVECSTCHGEPFVPEIIATSWKSR